MSPDRRNDSKAYEWSAAEIVCASSLEGVSHGQNLVHDSLSERANMLLADGRRSTAPLGCTCACVQHVVKSRLGNVAVTKPEARSVCDGSCIGGFHLGVLLSWMIGLVLGELV